MVMLTYPSLIRISDFTGSVKREIRGHTDYVYQVINGEPEQLISCGEDHTAVSVLPLRMQMGPDMGDSASGMVCGTLTQGRSANL